MLCYETTLASNTFYWAFIGRGGSHCLTNVLVSQHKSTDVDKGAVERCGSMAQHRPLLGKISQCIHQQEDVFFFRAHFSPGNSARALSLPHP